LKLDCSHFYHILDEKSGGRVMKQMIYPLDKRNTKKTKKPKTNPAVSVGPMDSSL